LGEKYLIYFIRSYNKYIKIGRSYDPTNRCKTLQTGNPVKLRVKAILPGDSKTEKALHEMFSHIHHQGEWFRYTKELKFFMRAIQENPEINNISELQKIALKMRLVAKSKRLGSNHKLSKRLARYISLT
jgi:hypothetical protein